MVWSRAGLSDWLRGSTLLSGMICPCHTHTKTHKQLQTLAEGVVEFFSTLQTDRMMIPYRTRLSLSSLFLRQSTILVPISDNVIGAHGIAEN